MLNVAVIGAGAIAQQAYLPAVRELPNANLRWVVDIDRDRAQTVGTAFGSDGYATDTDTALAETDIAIVATPPAFHAEISRTYLEAGVHVFTEKPIAKTSEEAERLLSLADEQDLHYGISRQQREAPACQLLHRFANNGALGEIEQFRVRFGDRTAWDFASDYRVQAAAAEGGVLTDKGPHVLDIVLWIFGDGCSVARYQDDSFGGLEANSLLALSFEREGISGTIEITGSRQIDHEFSITGTAGEISVDPGGSTGTLMDFDADFEMTVGTSQECPNSYLLRIGAQTKRFVDAVETGDATYVPAESGRAVLDLIERCYDTREPMHKSWELVGLDSSQPDSEKQPIRTEVSR